MIRPIYLPVIVACGLLLFTAACGPRSALGLRLPDGNAERGKQAFIDLKCVSCHSVASVDFGANDYKGRMNVVLGEETLFVKTYGELVSSVINPSHIISAKYKEQLKVEGKLSPMPEFNRVMTVEQMIDLVAFLQQHYRLPEPNPVIAD